MFSRVSSSWTPLRHFRAGKKALLYSPGLQMRKPRPQHPGLPPTQAPPDLEPAAALPAEAPPPAHHPIPHAGEQVGASAASRTPLQTWYFIEAHAALIGTQAPAVLAFTCSRGRRAAHKASHLSSHVDGKCQRETQAAQGPTSTSRILCSLWAALTPPQPRLESLGMCERSKQRAPQAPRTRAAAGAWCLPRQMPRSIRGPVGSSPPS